MALGNSSAAAGVSVLDEMRAAVRGEADAARARGLPLKTAAPAIARRLGLLSARRVLAYLHGEVAEDDVRAIELEAVRRARRSADRAAAADAAWAADIAEIKARLRIMERRMGDGSAAGIPPRFLRGQGAQMDGSV